MGRRFFCFRLACRANDQSHNGIVRKSTKPLFLSQLRGLDEGIKKKLPCGIFWEDFAFSLTDTKSVSI